MANNQQITHTSYSTIAKFRYESIKNVKKILRLLTKQLMQTFAVTFALNMLQNRLLLVGLLFGLD